MDASLLQLLEKTRRIGTWRVDLKENRLLWSDVTYEIHEEDPSREVTLDEAIEYYVPEHRSIISSCVFAAIDERKPWNVELQIRTTTGKVRWVHAIGEPFFEGDELVGLQGMFEDIDQRKRLELEREFTLQRLQEGERIARVGHWRLDAPGEVFEWTGGMFRLFERSGDRGSPRFDEVVAHVHPDDRAGFEAAMRGTEEFSSEFRIVVDGETRFLRTEGRPRLDDDGTFLGFAGVAVDDTVRRRAQRQVEELNRRLSLALDASAVGVWDWRVDTGRLVWDERSLALYGLEPNEFSERFSAWTAYVTEPDRGPLVDALHAASADGSSVDVAFTIQRGDGAVRTIQAIGDAVAGSDGRVVRMIGVQRDVTEMLQTQRELERSNEELAQFAYRTSHDLKGPLVSIRRLAEFASEDLREERPDDVLRGLSMIEERVDALGSKVRGILDAARADLADTPDEPVAVARLVDDVLALHAPLAGERPVELTAQLDGQTHPHLPRGRLEQILSNLVANGVRYASPERELSFVRVRVSCGPRAIELSVEDNGAGLPDQDPDAPYQMFRRFHSDRSGSGLGLFIVKKHVDAMGGTITHRSSAAGTVFELVLPLAVEGVPC